MLLPPTYLFLLLFCDRNTSLVIILSVRPDLETDSWLTLSSSASFWFVSCFCCFINSWKMSSLVKHSKTWSCPSECSHLLYSWSLWLSSWSLVSWTDVSNRLMIWCLQLSWWWHGCISWWYLIPNYEAIITFYTVVNFYMVMCESSTPWSETV